MFIKENVLNSWIVEITKFYELRIMATGSKSEQIIEVLIGRYQNMLGKQFTNREKIHFIE